MPRIVTHLAARSDSRTVPAPVTRRQALAALGGAAAAACVGSSLGRAAEETPRIKKAVKIGMVQVDGGLLEKFRLLKELGYDGVELDSPNGYGDGEALRARDETGLPIHGVVDSVHWNHRLSDPDPKIRARGVAALKTAIVDSKSYGGTSVLLVPGKVTPDATYEECWNRSQAEIRKVLPFAEDEGIDILLENVWNDFLTDPQATAKYIDELDSPRIGAYFDVGNTVKYSQPATWIPVLGKRIKKLDIKEFSKEEGKGFNVPLTEGDCDWPAVMAELRKIDYRGWGTAEVAGGGPEYLADLAARMNRAFAS